jgi:superfamily II DNA or RNA helicase
MTSHKKQNKFIDLKINGRLFPSWILANFKKYKLDNIFQTDSDACNSKDLKLELTAYQKFISSYLDYKSPFKDILLYHGLGSGKTRTTINVYNILYNYTPGWNVFILLKAILEKMNWKDEIEKWLQKEDLEDRKGNIYFIHYDSPIAHKQFLEVMSKVDRSKKSLFIIEESQNFIRNVYSNINSREGQRAKVIYDYIIEKKNTDDVRVVLLSGTPAINSPFELALTFNLLRPGIFPNDEVSFNKWFVSTGQYKRLRPEMKNVFQRRIMGLVSYYVGATPDRFASKKVAFIDVPMHPYQSDVYKHFEEIEDAMRKKQKNVGSKSQESYRTTTRQACNFVFPHLSQRVTGELRPRPKSFKISDKLAEKLQSGSKDTLLKDQEKKYIQALQVYITELDEFFQSKHNDDLKNKYTLAEDMKVFQEKYNNNFNEFLEKEKKKSSLFQEMSKCSNKMLCIIFHIFLSKGPVIVYSNYVLMEGLEVFKVYLKYFGFNYYLDKKTNDYFRYAEIRGEVSGEKIDREDAIKKFNLKDNVYGKEIKIILISPAGAEGLNLFSVRQVHIMEPYWNEARIEQMIGRGIRQCSHKYLPIEERHVDVYRYKSVRKNGKETTDQYIEFVARNKASYIESFLEATKEVAVDCELFKGHNMLNQSYQCFQFDSQSLLDKNIGPAYKQDIKDDIKISRGLNSTKSKIVRIKALKINAVKLLSNPSDESPKYSKPEQYLYHSETGHVYDMELHFLVGSVSKDENNAPNKLDKDTYIIDQLVPIPQF